MVNMICWECKQEDYEEMFNQCNKCGRTYCDECYPKHKCKP